MLQARSHRSEVGCATAVATVAMMLLSSLWLTDPAPRDPSPVEFFRSTLAIPRVPPAEPIQPRSRREPVLVTVPSPTRTSPQPSVAPLPSIEPTAQPRSIPPPLLDPILDVLFPKQAAEKAKGPTGSGPPGLLRSVLQRLRIR